MTPVQAIFKDIVVVEFAAVLAGPAVGMFFAELGAKVIKVENKATHGDMTRSWKLPSEDPNSPISAYYCSVNWGKEHIFLDLSDLADQASAQKLVQEADIVLANFKPSAAARFGLDAASCLELNPRLIYGQIQAYPDPEDPRPAFDMVMQAETGFLHITGEPDRPPVKIPVALIDLLAAHQLKEGILIALLQRNLNGGKGCTVSVSLQEAAIASLANQATNWLMAGHIPQPIGSRHPNIAPYGDFFPCQDGKPIVLAVGTERQWISLCAAVGRKDLATHPDFSQNTARVQHRAALNSELSTAFLQHERDTWLGIFAQKGIPAAAIRTLDEVFAQPEAQAMLLEEISPEGVHTKRVKTAVFHFGEKNNDKNLQNPQ